MFERGSFVRVKGLGGEEAILRVWEKRRRGLLLCTEKGYQNLVEGKEASIVGFPMCDIIGLVKEDYIHQ